MNEPQITVVGNVVADPELRMSGAGRAWLSLRIASTPRVRDRETQQWTDGEPLWISCLAFGDFAENISSSVSKGMRVVVQGKLSSRSYVDSQGQQRTGLELMIDEIGPSLRFATANVTRVASRSGSGSYGAESGGFGGAPAAVPQNAWGDQPVQQAPSTHNPWGDATGASDFGEDVRF